MALPSALFHPDYYCFAQVEPWLAGQHIKGRPALSRSQAAAAAAPTALSCFDQTPISTDRHLFLPFV